jgi:DNA-binding response OmpR family regulator
MPKKILIVDDNDLVSEMMSYILTSNGYVVDTLNCGEGVVDSVHNNHPDLVILDAFLPDIDGRDICKTLKLDKNTRDMPVIICSGNDDIEQSLAQEGGPNDVLHKPFDISSLIYKVQTHLAA